MKYAIYGAGYFGECFYKQIDVPDINVECWLDTYKSGQTKFGKKIISLQQADKGLTVIIAVIPLVKSERHLIKKTLSQYGFNNVIDFFDAVELWPNVYHEYAKLEHLWMRDDSNKMIVQEEVEWLRNRLCDDKSREVLDKLISFRLTLSATDYPSPDHLQEYYPEDINFKTMDSLRFIDCGAYTGDTVDDFVSLHKNKKLTLSSIISFEPDANNFEKLSETVAKHTKKLPEISMLTIPAGVWKNTDILSFSNEMNSSSTFKSPGIENVDIPVISLDSTCFGFAPNFIKMDIEGSEAEALEGCRKIISTYQPILAICVYHKPFDLWELPRLIESISANYDMHLRVHEHLGLSTVLYCIPKN